MGVFTGRTAIVTGAGSGIGRALALQLSERKARVIVTDMVPERVEKVVTELRRNGAEAAGYLVDHSKKEEVEAFAKSFFAEWGRVDILCLNAGVGLGGRIDEYSLADWEWLMGVNLWGPIYMLHFFVPKMIEQNQGRILITASGAGLIALPGLSAYSASKFAMVGLAESLRIELGKHNIVVSALCPGVIDTSIVNDARVYLSDSAGANVKGKLSELYAKRGTDPAVAARDGLRALAWDEGIKPSPLHMWPPYLLKRFSPALYQSLARLLWKTGWLG